MGAAVAMQVAIRHPARIRRLVCMSVSYRTEGMHAEMTQAADVESSIEQLEGSPFQHAYQAVAPEPERWPDLVRKVLELDAKPQDWPADQVAGIRTPTMLIAADNDIVRLEHAVEMYHLLGGGVFGDIHGLPASRLAIIPGTTHIGISDRAKWVVPMVAEFLGSAS